ncbi:MAG: hypothetical protein ACRD2W_23470, partial [Acidimicrobiales bacterium]
MSDDPDRPAGQPATEGGGESAVAAGTPIPDGEDTESEGVATAEAADRSPAVSDGVDLRKPAGAAPEQDDPGPEAGTPGGELGEGTGGDEAEQIEWQPVGTGDQIEWQPVMAAEAGPWPDEEHGGAPEWREPVSYEGDDDYGDVEAEATAGEGWDPD